MLSLRNGLAFTATLFLLTTTAGYAGHHSESTRKQDNSSSTAAHEQNNGIAHTTHTATHGSTHVPKHAHTVAHLAGHSDLDSVALADIRRYASHHFADARELSHTFRAEHNWARDWELHWVDYVIDGHVVRLYHAGHKHDPALRFTSLLHHTDGHYQGWHHVE
jgi:hypothetical protein